MKTYSEVPRRELPDPSPALKRRKPRSYSEWKALRRWGTLPRWEEGSPGFLLRDAREQAGMTQRELAERLGCSQQAVAQAERWSSNPTIRFARAWVRALGRELEISIS